MNIEKYLYFPKLEKKSYIGRIWGYAWRGWAVSFVFTVLAFALYSVVEMLVQNPEKNELKSLPLDGATVYLVVVIVPIVEECICRGPLRLALCWERRPKWLLGALLVVTSVAFGAIHVGNFQNPWTYVAFYFGFVKAVDGLIGGWVCIASRSLAAPMIKHSLSNALATALQIIFYSTS